MPKLSNTLSDVHVRKLTHVTNSSGKPIAKMHAVGGVSGLHLHCKPTGAKSWILRVKIGDKRTDLGLGAYPRVSLKQAREIARERKLTIQNGVNPIAEQRAKKAALAEEQAQHITFEEYSKRFVVKQAKEYATTEQVRRLKQLLTKYAHPFIGNLRLKDIKRKHIVQLLEPIWEEKNHTAQRTLRYVRRILQQAIAEELRTDANPAEWKDDLEHTFPKGSKVAPVEHHKYIDWRELPMFMKALDAWDSPTNSKPISKCFAFMVLTVARPSAARLAEWDEIDFDKKVWTIPADKPKRKVTEDWEIPLTKEAIMLLKSLPSYASQTGRLFNRLDGTEIPYNTAPHLPKKLGFDCAAHGFRSTFRTWGQDKIRFNEEVLELCMTHKVGNTVRDAYARSELLDERRKVLAEYNKWAMTGKQNNNVTDIRQKRAG
jgi:integrase